MSKKDDTETKAVKADITIVPIDPPSDPRQPPPDDPPLGRRLDSVTMEAMLLRELDEATQLVYAVFADSLIEGGELQATPWHGLNEMVKKAWRTAVKFTRDQEAVIDASR